MSNTNSVEKGVKYSPVFFVSYISQIVIKSYKITQEK